MAITLQESLRGLFYAPFYVALARDAYAAEGVEVRFVSAPQPGDAARAIIGGASLLPAGVTGIDGTFARGDCVVIRNAAGGEIGRGLIAYDAGEAAQIMGRSSRDIEKILGYSGRVAMIHRDDMALGGE